VAPLPALSLPGSTPEWRLAATEQQRVWAFPRGTHELVRRAFFLCFLSSFPHLSMKLIRQRALLPATGRTSRAQDRGIHPWHGWKRECVDWRSRNSERVPSERPSVTAAAIEPGALAPGPAAGLAVPGLLQDWRCLACCN
jgi:hypothetical protein